MSCYKDRSAPQPYIHRPWKTYTNVTQPVRTSGVFCDLVIAQWRHDTAHDKDVSSTPYDCENCNLGTMKLQIEAPVAFNPEWRQNSQKRHPAVVRRAIRTIRRDNPMSVLKVRRILELAQACRRDLRPQPQQTQQHRPYVLVASARRLYTRPATRVKASRRRTIFPPTE